MNQLPVVTISRADGGHTVLCSCGTKVFRYTRPEADIWAHNHRATHGLTRRWATPKTKEATS